MKSYPLAPNGIFRTVQGEGALLGVPMVFVRLAGCSIGCPGCDTDYRVAERKTAAEIRERMQSLGPCRWAWITGGEPADHELRPLLEEIPSYSQVAVATSGSKSLGDAVRLVDFVSVSPHGKPSELVLTRGSQINLVPGLNGLDLADWQTFDASGFAHRYVTPLWYGPGDRAERVSECMAFVESHPNWRMGVQAHKSWGIA